MRVERLGLGQLLLLMLLLLLFLPSVLGLGLSYEYLEEKTLTLAPGEQHFFKLTFQNDEPESVRVSVLLESEIAELVGDAEITIPAETYDTFVYFDIQVPEEANTWQYVSGQLRSPAARGWRRPSFPSPSSTVDGLT
jgi:hypothetical protein